MYSIHTGQYVQHCNMLLLYCTARYLYLVLCKQSSIMIFLCSYIMERVLIPKGWSRTGSSPVTCPRRSRLYIDQCTVIPLYCYIYRYWIHSLLHTHRAVCALSYHYTVTGTRLVNHHSDRILLRLLNDKFILKFGCVWVQTRSWSPSLPLSNVNKAKA